jgi:hypothetical protein
VRFLGLWESDIESGAPAALLKITEDGRVNYRRPQVLDPPVVGRAFRVRLPSLLSLPHVALCCCLFFEQNMQQPSKDTHAVLFQGRLRSLLPTKMQVNVLGTLVYDEIALDGPPRMGPVRAVSALLIIEVYVLTFLFSPLGRQTPHARGRGRAGSTGQRSFRQHAALLARCPSAAGVDHC